MIERAVLLSGAYVATAAVAFGLGGVCMKWSEGFTRAPATAGVFLFFLLGAGLQTLAMTRGDLGVVYVVVLGLEAVLAVGLGIWLFQEQLTPMRLLAIVLIVAGIAILR
jgi:small multidrug resistance pump/quaternary ammonium compound-resistance protein SugE